MDYIFRDKYIEKIKKFIDKPIVKILTGMRRVGKSTILNIISAIDNDNGLTDEDILVTHDAVRPFVSIKMIDENIESCKKYNIIDTVVPAFDTIVVSKDGKFISSIPDRKTMFQGQTPQTFKINKFMEYYNKLTDEEKNILTDACKVFVLNNTHVGLVQGEYSNIKITTVTDLKIAEAMLGEI